MMTCGTIIAAVIDTFIERIEKCYGISLLENEASNLSKINNFSQTNLFRNDMHRCADYKYKRLIQERIRL